MPVAAISRSCKWLIHFFPSCDARRSSSRSASYPSRKIPPSFSTNGGSSTTALPSFSSRTGIGRAAAFLRDVRRARRARPTKIGAINQLLQFAFQLRDLLQREFQSDQVACVSRGLTQSRCCTFDIANRFQLSADCRKQIWFLQQI